MHGTHGGWAKSDRLRNECAHGVPHWKPQLLMNYFKMPASWGLVLYGLKVCVLSKINMLRS